MKYPPLQFYIVKERQPWLRRAFFWNQFINFVHEWNTQQKAKFEERTPGEWKLTLPAGCTDEEYLLLIGKLEQLGKFIMLMWEYGVLDERTENEFALCPFVHFTSDYYEDDFYVNARAVLVNEVRCKHCGEFARFSGYVIGAPVIRESWLDHENDPGLDFISMPNGALLITQKVKSLLESLNVKSYRIYPVINIDSGKASERLFLIAASFAVLDPCTFHTPRAEGAICPHCSSHTGAVAGHFHVQDVQLKGCEIFAVNRSGATGLFFSQRIFQEFKKAGLKEMHVIDGIEYCVHTTGN